MGDAPSTGGGFSDALLGAANAFFTVEAMDEAIDLMDEAGGRGPQGFSGNISNGNVEYSFCCIYM